MLFLARLASFLVIFAHFLVKIGLKKPQNDPNSCLKPSPTFRKGHKRARDLNIGLIDVLAPIDCRKDATFSHFLRNWGKKIKKPSKNGVFEPILAIFLKINYTGFSVKSATVPPPKSTFLTSRTIIT